MREKEKKRAWWKALLKRLFLDQAFLKRLMYICRTLFFSSLACFPRGHTDGAWTLSALNNRHSFSFQMTFPSFLQKDVASLSLMHYKYPITTCWLALWDPVACWRTTLQTKLINGIIIRRTNGQATHTDWVILPHHVAWGLFLNPVWWFLSHSNQTQLG